MKRPTSRLHLQFEPGGKIEGAMDVVKQLSPLLQTAGIPIDWDAWGKKCIECLEPEQKKREGECEG